jgi:GrpB-like predicted nucleotidyltransferase (UPF0157 family)
MANRVIQVVNYDPTWPQTFEFLCARLSDVLHGLELSIEHVGSTSVVGLAAKPVIDMDVVAKSVNDVTVIIQRLGSLGYRHCGDLGIPQREAFQEPRDLPSHHLYVCLETGIALCNHLTVRDQLRVHPEAAKAYGALKKSLADRYPHDIESYVRGKTEFLLSILSATGWSAEMIDNVRSQNAGPVTSVNCYLYRDTLGFELVSDSGKGAKKVVHER